MALLGAAGAVVERASGFSVRVGQLLPARERLQLAGDGRRGHDLAGRRGLNFLHGLGRRGFRLPGFSFPVKH